MNVLELPSRRPFLPLRLLLLALFADHVISTATVAPSAINTTNVNRTTAVPANGTGPAYASACSAAVVAYSSRSSSWTSKHQWVKPTTLLLGGTSLFDVTYYENATTLCDGHARVTSSPAISLSHGTRTVAAPVTGTTTILGTYFSDYPGLAPTCSIHPRDCDFLWSQYNASSIAASTITPAPWLATPPCVGVEEAASLLSVSSMIYGCGRCTIFGEGVQLVYFPTTASRDMCASMPTASRTHYASDAVITAFSGKNFTGSGSPDGNRTIVADGHTFTSGTAYISISTVYAIDRCSRTFGSPVRDAILAMPSESVLSLRYSQDHFQRLMETDRITGFPVSYADFNSPVPWSAWNGQVMCDPGSSGGWACSIIYENSFRPQLAIPPQITDLSPDFKGCQMWYNGLWDPPLALQPVASIATPTLPIRHSPSSVATSAAPSPTAASPTVRPTAPSVKLPLSAIDHPALSNEELPSVVGYSTHSGEELSSAVGYSTPSGVAAFSSLEATTTPSPHILNPYNPAGEPWIQSFSVNGHNVWATGANRQVAIGTVTLTAGGPTKTLADGAHVSYGDDGLVVGGVSTVAFENGGIVTQIPGGETVQTPVATYILSGLKITADRSTILVEIDGQTKTAVQSSRGGPVVIDHATTLTPGGPAMTLSHGEVLSATDDTLVVDWTSTVGVDMDIAGDGSAPDETRGSEQQSSRPASSTALTHTSLGSPAGGSSAMSDAAASATGSSGSKLLASTKGCLLAALLLICTLGT